MEVTIDHKNSIAFGSFGASASQLSIRMEGRKSWLSHNRLRFETSQHNVSLLLSLFPEAVVKDTRLDGDALRAMDEAPTTPSEPVAMQWVLPPRDFQLVNFERFKTLPQFAIFSEQGTGKTKVALDIISWRFLSGLITGVLVLSSPKGVHAQWINEQLPKHLWRSVPVLTYIWEGKKPPEWLGKPSKELQFISGNIDMLRGKAGYDLLSQFALHHKQKLMIIVDESDSIKNKNATRSRKLREIAAHTKMKAIMTGTPIARDLVDEWSQFYFLNPDIIGHKYLTSFRAQFCVMGGWQNKAVVGHKNIDTFKKLTAPYVFRATKKDLDLPDKVYDSVVFDLSSEQKKHIKALRDHFYSSLPSGTAVAVKTGATALIRIQQISNGFTVDENQAVAQLIENPRYDALVDLRRQISGPTVIWCRFKLDVQLLKGAFPNSVTIYGEDDQEARAKAKEAFLSGKATELIATPGAAGKGVDGLQSVCSDAIYYSNSFNAIDRWQSEDRIHRIGMNGTATYFDLIARGSIDRSILANLRRKKDISSMVLDDIKNIMDQIE